MDFDQLCGLGTAMRHAGASVETVLLALRAEGASQGSSLRVLRAVEGGTIGEWKSVVDGSPVWADHQASNEMWRKGLIDAVDELSEGRESDG